MEKWGVSCCAKLPLPGYIREGLVASNFLVNSPETVVTIPATKGPDKNVAQNLLE
jgi:hypothetical protein